MKIEILGASGGIGKGLYTTCLRINDHTLIDAGSGLGNLPNEELRKIQRVFLTHAHLDHIAFLPLLIDVCYEFLQKPIEVFALPEVISVLKTHIFNWSVWPDFTVLPNAEHPVLKLHPVTYPHPLAAEELRLTPFLVEHVVPCCGWLVEADGVRFAFTGDTTANTNLLNTLNGLGRLDALMIECAFPDRLADLAHLSKHITPKLLFHLHEKMQHPCSLWISHLKPSQTEEITQQLQDYFPENGYTLLHHGMEMMLNKTSA